MPTPEQARGSPQLYIQAPQNPKTHTALEKHKAPSSLHLLDDRPGWSKEPEPELRMARGQDRKADSSLGPQEEAPKLPGLMKQAPYGARSPLLWANQPTMGTPILGSIGQTRA